MKSQDGFTLVELLLALSLGALVFLLLFRGFTLAVAAQEDTRKQIAVYQEARTTLQWIAGTIQAASEIRHGSASTLELAGMFEAARGLECRGFLLGRIGAMRGTVLYERRRTSCPEGATSARGELVVVSDPTVSIPLLAFRFFDDKGRLAPDPADGRLIEVTVGIDATRDGLPDYRLVQVAGLRAW